jgi:hypothetical protein
MYPKTSTLSKPESLSLSTGVGVGNYSRAPMILQLLLCSKMFQFAAYLSVNFFVPLSFNCYPSLVFNYQMKNVYSNEKIS